jgi:REP-associated tyrosine transposase
MARSNRFKVLDGSAWYHLYNKVGGVGRGEYPLADTSAARKLMEFFELYASVYECVLAALCVMGNHYHAVAFFKEYRQLSRRELRRRAKLINPGPLGEERLDCWGDEDWERFNRRLFDVSDFMKDVQQRFSVWHNTRHKCCGHFWADRFKATLLEGPRIALDATLYVELNPVRAGMVKRPEDHKYSSCFLRNIKKASSFMSLEELTGIADVTEAGIHYRSLLYWRGAVPTREKQAAIPEEIVAAEEARDFKAHGCFLRKVAYYRDGLVLGSSEYIAGMLDAARESGLYKRRKNPIKSKHGGPECYMRAYLTDN